MKLARVRPAPVAAPLVQAVRVLEARVAPQFDEVDAAADALVFVGLGVGLRESALGQWAIPMGIVAGVAVAAIFWLVMRVETLEGERAAELPGIAGFDVDENAVTFVWPGGEVEELPLLSKAEVAGQLWDRIEKRLLGGRE